MTPHQPPVPLAPCWQMLKESAASTHLRANAVPTRLDVSGPRAQSLGVEPSAIQTGAAAVYLCVCKCRLQPAASTTRRMMCSSTACMLMPAAKSLHSTPRSCTSAVSRWVKEGSAHVVAPVVIHRPIRVIDPSELPHDMASWPLLVFRHSAHCEAPAFTLLRVWPGTAVLLEPDLNCVLRHPALLRHCHRHEQSCMRHLI